MNTRSKPLLEFIFFSNKKRTGLGREGRCRREEAIDEVRRGGGGRGRGHERGAAYAHLIGQ